MQPYLFPYLGYFQLIKAVDLYIVYDDVQWMKGGWINRNRILESGKPVYVTLPVKKDSVTKHINERYFVENFDVEKKMLLNRINEAYQGAPHFDETIKLLENIFSYTEQNAALFLLNSLQLCCEYMNITTEISLSSQIDKTLSLKAQKRVIDINESVGSTDYINAIGGKELYDTDTFAQHGITLSFIKSIPVEYKQFSDTWVPHLSIIDVLMFNSKKEVNRMLESYELE